MTSGLSTMNRRTFLQASGLAASAVMLAGCAKGSDSGPAAANAITSAGWDDSIGDLMNGTIAQQFEAKSGVKMQAQASVAFGDFQTRFRTLLAGGAPPDVMRLNDDFLREVSDKSLSVDLTPYFTKSGLKMDDYFENLFNFSKLPSGQRAIVVGAQVRCIFYNKTMFEKEGIKLPPTTWTPGGWKWDDFLDAAKGVTKGNQQFGAVIIKDTAYENTWAVNNGGDGIFSTDGKKFTLADPVGYEAIQWAADLALKHKVTPKYGDIQADQAEQRLFTAGKLGMIMNSSSNVGYYNKNVKDFEWDIAPIPAKVNQVQEGGVVVYIIPSKAKNPDQAWEYLNYAAGPEGGKVLAEAGLCVPVNKAAAESLKSPGDYPKNIKLLVAGADHNRIVNSTSATAAAVAIYRPQLQRVYSGEITAEKALTSVRSQVEAAIAGA